MFVHQLNDRPFLRLYEQIVQEAPRYSTIIEIGVFRGTSLLALAALVRKHNRRDLRVFGVDDWSDRAYPPGHEQPPRPDARRAVQGMLQMAGFADMVKLISSDSVLAADEFEDESVYFAYIDGGHDFETVKGDIRAWLPKIIPGGMLAGDDLDHELLPDVRRAVEDVLGEEGVGWQLGGKDISNIKGYWMRNVAKEK